MGTVLLTPVVAGVSEERKVYKISIHIAPKLDAGPLPEVFKTWPSTVRKTEFKAFNLEFGRVNGNGTINASGSQTISASAVGVSVTPSISDIAYQMILGNSHCESFNKLQEINKSGAKVADVTVKTFDTKQVADCVREINKLIFSKAAELTGLSDGRILGSPQDVLTSLTEKHYPLNDIVRRKVVQARAAVAVISDGGPIFERDRFRLTHTPASLYPDAERDLKLIENRQTDPRQTSTISNPLIDHAVFWKRIPRTKTTVDSEVKINDPDREFDFHERIALLGNYASLLRDFGLVIDVTLAFDTAKQIIENFSAIRLQFGPAFKSLFGTIVPSSWWVGYNAKFLPLSIEGSIKDGYLNLQKTHRLETLDVDGDGHKLTSFFYTMAATLKETGDLDKFQKDNLQKTLPAPSRSLGISLIETERHARLKNSLERSKKLSQDPDQVLLAEDLARGYVVDLWAESPDGQSKDWFPLCLRHEEFSILGYGKLKGGLAEGSIKPGATQATDKLESQLESQPKRINELYVHEAVARWRGDYLCIGANQSQVLASQGESISPGKGFGLIAKMTAPQKDGRILTQPPLRVMGKYGMAVRVETIAGDRVPFSKNPLQFLSPITFDRAEPLPAPAVLFTILPEKNEKLEEIVIRSTDGTDPSAEIQRLLVAPRVIREVAELHTATTQVEELIEGFTRLELDSQGRLNKVAQAFGDTPDVPYLPDPIASEVTAIFVDDIRLPANDKQATDSVQRLPLYDPARESVEWPNPTVHLLAVSAQKHHNGEIALPRVSKEDNFIRRVAGMNRNSCLLQIKIPAGWTGTLKLQSGFGVNGSEHLSGMALWRQLSDMTRSSLNMTNLLRGDHPLLCTPRYLRIIHAVQRPLRAASLTNSFTTCPPKTTTRVLLERCITRIEGSTSAQIDFKFKFDRKSTGKLKVEASWKDTADPLTGALATQNGRSVILETLVRSNKEASDVSVEDNEETFSVTHDFGDTRFRVLTVGSAAISRFRGYFSSEPDSESLRAGDDLVVELKNSARPAIPDVLYAVPAFRWRKPENCAPGTFGQSRKGAGLRVFFRRPHLGTGEDELLGVVISQTQEVLAAIQSEKATAVPISNAAKDATDNFVTRWGSDPSWKSSSGENTSLGLVEWWISTSKETEEEEEEDHRVSTDAINLQTASGACGWNLSLKELQSPSGANDTTNIVAVVAYKPELDQERNLWFCDLTFDRSPEYGVFLRLALANYQPHSVPNCEISAVKIIDFAQLHADRTITIQRKKLEKRNNEEGLFVQLFGMANPGGFLGKGNLIEVTLEKRTYTDKHGFGWQQVSDAENKTQIFPDSASSESPPRGCDQLLWSGYVLPDPICANRRLVITEYEQFDQDDTSEITKRLVYMDALEID